MQTINKREAYLNSKNYNKEFVLINTIIFFNFLSTNINKIIYFLFLLC